MASTIYAEIDGFVNMLNKCAKNEIFRDEASYYYYGMKITLSFVTDENRIEVDMTWTRLGMWMLHARVYSACNGNLLAESCGSTDSGVFESAEFSMFPDVGISTFSTVSYNIKPAQYQPLTCSVFARVDDALKMYFD
jgi:hypothetical protein